MFGKWANAPNMLLYQLNPIESQWLQMLSKKKKKTMQSSTFSLPCGIRLIISSKNSIGFNWESNGFGVFAHFPT